MKDSTILFRSLAIIIFIAGIAHLATYASQDNRFIKKNDTIKNQFEKTTSNDYEQDFSKDYLETDYIIGKWKVNYNNNDFKGAILYDLKKEGNEFNAYTYEYLDGEGNSKEAEPNKTLTIKSFDGYQGNGIYRFDYEGEQFQVDCSIDMLDENTFQLRYDYYGYADVETWKRQ